MTISKTILMGAAAVAVACTLVNAADRPDGLYAELETTKGKIVLSLEFEKTPMTVANFVGLAEGTKDSNKPKGTRFYDGLTFHRVIPDFMIQGGDPQGTGGGGPGYSFPDETRKDLVHSGAGILSMANSDPQGSKAPFSNKGSSNGSQFFITHKETSWLDGFHTVFGHVIEGQDVVNKIVKGDKINTVTIVRVGDPAKAFKADQAHFDELLGAAKEKGVAAVKEAAAQQLAQLEEVIANLKKDNPGKELVTTASGLRYIVVKPGEGAKPAPGTNIKAHYTGKFVDGRIFDSSVARGEPISFAVGKGGVIKGWDEALLDMKKGEKRILIIPPELAYGQRGHPGGIPPDTTLIFEVELVEF